MPKSNGGLVPPAVQFELRTVCQVLFTPGGLLQYRELLQALLPEQASCQHASLRSTANRYQNAPTICKDSSNT
jgi:hypothetical protein